MNLGANIGLAASDPALAQILEACERHELSVWEREFVRSVKERRKPPTDKQLAILNRIAEGPPDYAAINAAALRHIEDLVARWLPDGKTSGHEYTARNPRRGDRHLGSFKVNFDTGRWGDFACGAGGGDPISLAAYLFELAQPEAARRLAGMLGLSRIEMPDA
jgi:hypothetical protein